MGQPAVKPSAPPRVSAVFEGRDWVLFIFASPVPGIGQILQASVWGNEENVPQGVQGSKTALSLSFMAASKDF